MKRFAAVLVAAALCLAATGATAEEPATEKESWIADLKLGTHWGGPEVALEDLQGKVVLFVIWGS